MSVLLRYGFQESQFYLKRRFSAGHSGSVGNPENVRVNCDGWLAKGCIEDNIGCFSPNTRQCFQTFPIVRNFSVVFFQQDFAGFDDVGRFRIVEADRADVSLQLVLSQIQHAAWSIGEDKEFSGGLVYTDIGGLCGEHDGGQKFERVFVFKLGFRPGRY